MTENTSIFAQRLDALRGLMAEQGLDGYIIPRTDEYQGEYVPANEERLAWLTGFTGSAGVAVVLKDKAVVMSDGRYTIQLEQQVDSSVYHTDDNTKTPVEEWIETHINKNDTIGFDGRLFTPSVIQKIQQKLKDSDVIVKPISENLIDKLWEDRPDAPKAKVEVFSEKIAGRSHQEKLDEIAASIKEQGADLGIITLSDSIAWLLNIRGGDVPHIPIALSYLIVKSDATADWFIHEDKLSDSVRTHLGNRVAVYAPETLEALLKEAVAGKSVLLDPKRTSLWFHENVQAAGGEIIEAKDPCIDIRSRKTKSEQDAMRQAHIRDGVAVVKFLKWLEEHGPSGQESELSVEEHLKAFRAEAAEFKDTSFDTIAGFNANGAIVHYRATEETSQTIKAPGLLLVDSGAQYADGTTDITRTVAIGEPTDEMCERNTLVLKGHIAVAAAAFKKGTLGKEIDALARKPLQDEGLDYAHGTGHGVGVYLSVHEEAAHLSPKGEEAPQAGMILSNEPGYYKEGEYGIRIENLVLVREADDEHLEFETITLAPLDTSLIIKDMLTQDELDWLNAYHAHVYKTLSPFLDEEHQNWLEIACAQM
ncbi:MAG: aminopeptidase P family protein [Pseudomonadota bacterium]